MASEFRVLFRWKLDAQPDIGTRLANLDEVPHNRTVDLTVRAPFPAPMILVPSSSFASWTKLTSSWPPPCVGGERGRVSGSNLRSVLSSDSLQRFGLRSPSGCDQECPTGVARLAPSFAPELLDKLAYSAHGMQFANG